MATRGRNICNTLKAIRKQIADANGISYSPEECHFKGECKGTCPKCEQDVRDLEHELHLRQMAGGHQGRRSGFGHHRPHRIRHIVRHAEGILQIDTA